MIHYIICESQDYNSSAAYNRVKLICNGLNDNGVKVELHLQLYTIRKNRVFNYINLYFFTFFIHLFQLFSILRKVDKSDIVVIYGDINQFFTFPLFKRKTNLVVEHTEYPSFEICYDVSNRIGGAIREYISKQNLKKLKYASSLITCSSYLKNYYQEYVRDVLIIPLVVNLEEYKTREKKNEFGEYIAYCGSFNNNKDGLPILINAFKLFHDNHPQTRLVLIGSGAKKNLDKLREIVNDYGLADAVVFQGRLPHEEVGIWLSGATMLALARPNNRQAEGGVPSKVGEYLASGVPCVITRTGDLPDYLNDSVDCFFCDPDSVDAFAQRLEDCYYSDMKEIGRNAQEAAKQFDNRYQANRLMKFFSEKYGYETLM